MPCVLLQRKRAYAAHLSRWISTDPTWLADGVNLYTYVNGNPVSGVDPSGTTTEELNYKYEAYPKSDEVDNQPMVFRNDAELVEKSQNVQKKSVSGNSCQSFDKNVATSSYEPLVISPPQKMSEKVKQIVAIEKENAKKKYANIDVLVKKMVDTHLTMNKPLELTYIMTNKPNYDNSQMYVGFQRSENDSHTMGQMFVNVLEENKPYTVVHLHPEVMKIDRTNNDWASMFSDGDIANMKQDWIGIEFYREGEGYTIDVHYSSINLLRKIRKVENDCNIKNLPSVIIKSIKNYKPNNLMTNFNFIYMKEQNK